MSSIIEKLRNKFLANTLNRSISSFSRQKYNNLSALKCIVSYNKYGGYCVPESSRHRPAARRVLSNDIYEPETIEFILSRCGEGDIIHAGAYFGDFLPALSAGLAPGSKIWAFEPNLENYRCAKITIEINNLQNVVLANAALGAEHQKKFIQIADRQGQALGGASRLISNKPKELFEAGLLHRVDVFTVDEAIDSNRNISIIQLDVEGYEEEALAGALITIQRCLPIIILEVLPNSKLLSSRFFSSKILSLGYRKVGNICNNYVFSYDPHSATTTYSGKVHMNALSKV